MMEQFAAQLACARSVHCSSKREPQKCRRWEVFSLELIAHRLRVLWRFSRDPIAGLLALKAQA